MRAGARWETYGCRGTCAKFVSSRVSYSSTRDRTDVVAPLGDAREDTRTIVAAVGGVVERIAVLAVVATGRGGCLAHLLLAVGLEVCRVHGRPVAQHWLRVAQGFGRSRTPGRLVVSGSVQESVHRAQWLRVKVTGWVFVRCSLDAVVASRVGLSGRGGRKIDKRARPRETSAPAAARGDQYATMRQDHLARGTVVYLMTGTRHTGLGGASCYGGVCQSDGRMAARRAGRADEPHAGTRVLDRDKANAMRRIFWRRELVPAGEASARHVLWGK